jgi:hypothetical protein
VALLDRWDSAFAEAARHLSVMAADGDTAGDPAGAPATGSAKGSMRGRREGGPV